MRLRPRCYGVRFLGSGKPNHWVVFNALELRADAERVHLADFLTRLRALAKAEGTALVPFILAGVADVPDADRFFQPDRIHPTAEAQPRMLDNVWPALRPLLRAPG